MSLKDWPLYTGCNKCAHKRVDNIVNGTKDLSSCSLVSSTHRKKLVWSGRTAEHSPQLDSRLRLSGEMGAAVCKVEEEPWATKSRSF